MSLKFWGVMLVIVLALTFLADNLYCMGVIG